MRHSHLALALVSVVLLSATRAVAQRPGTFGYYMNRSGRTDPGPCRAESSLA